MPHSFHKEFTKCLLNDGWMDGWVGRCMKKCVDEWMDG